MGVKKMILLAIAFALGVGSFALSHGASSEQEKSTKGESQKRLTPLKKTINKPSSKGKRIQVTPKKPNQEMLIKKPVSKKKMPGLVPPPYLKIKRIYVMDNRIHVVLKNTGSGKLSQKRPRTEPVVVTVRNR
jgi:hypothetical protein